jgi:Cof subfamily protein (haloacid dehalogenase superfamily)
VRYRSDSAIHLDTNGPLGVPFQLIAADLDGTLLRSDGSLSSRTVAVLRAAARAGIGIAIVTARPPRRVRALLGDLELDALAICSNGAVVYDVRAHAIIEQTRLPAATAVAIVTDLRAALPELCFATEAGLQFGQEPAYRQRITGLTESIAPRYDDAEALCEDGVTKLIALHPTLDRDQLLARVHHVVAERAVVTHSGAPFAEISAQGVTKASALSQHCANRRIVREAVIAFGDMPNDIPMLTWAGRAVAVDNAHPEVRAIAHEITASNDDDGVALAIERLLDGVVDQRPQ